MNTILPFIAFAAAAAALILSPPVEPKPTKGGFIHGIVLILIALGAGYYWRNDYANLLPAAIAFSIGIGVAGLCGFVERIKVGSGAAAAGLGAGLAGLANWVDSSYLSMVQLALIAGLSLGAWCFATNEKGKLSLPLATALFGSVFLAADFMGGKALSNEPGAHFGSTLGLAVAMAGLIGLAAGRSEKRQDGGLPFLAGWLTVILLVALGYAVGARYLDSKESWMIFCGSVVIAAILNWVIRPTGQDDALAFLMSAVIWIGVATLAFSYSRGFGMTIALVGAISTLLLIGNVRALLSAGPLLGLVFYRVLREAFPAATRALDIGQHYAVIGLAFGLTLALLPVDWLKLRSRLTGLAPWGRALWVIALCLLPVGLSVVLGAKGMVGFVAGLGFAALIEGIRNGSSLIPLVLASALAAMTTVSYGWLTNLLDLTRETKQTAFYWIGGTALVLAILIASVSKADPTTSESSDSAMDVR